MRIHIFFILTIVFVSYLYASSQEEVYIYNQEGVNRLQRKDYQGAIEYFRKALRYEPTNQIIKDNIASAYNNYGLYLMQKGDVNLAIEKFEQALTYNSSNPYIYYNLAQAYYFKQDVDRASSYLDKAFSINPNIEGIKDFKLKLDKEKPLERSFNKIETTHFILSFSDGVEIEKISYIKVYLEEAYSRLGAFWDYYPSSKAVVLVYSEEEYTILVHNLPHWAMSIYDGKIRIPSYKFKYNKEDIVRIIYHEYGHYIVHQLIGSRECPLWLNEGIAAKSEDLVQPLSRELIKSYIDKFGIIHFSRFPNNISTQDVNIATWFYIQFYTLVDFMWDRWGANSIKSILVNIGKGANPFVSIGQVVNISYQDFYEEW